MQSKKLYVGNLDYSVSSQEIEELFAPFGSVTYVRVLEGKGFGFVEMNSLEEAEEAKKGLDGQEFKGRRLRIDEARSQPSKPRRGPGGGGGGGGGGGRRFSQPGGGGGRPSGRR